MKNKKEKFIKCGFEFTAAKKPDTYLDESLFHNKLNPKNIAQSRTHFHSSYLDENGKPRPLTERYTERELAAFDKSYIETLEKRDEEYIKEHFIRRKTELKPLHIDEDSTLQYNWSDKHLISPYEWICSKANSDSCGTEIATPILSSREEIRQHYLEFMAFVRTHNLTTDIDKAICGLGGCHIHFSIVQFPEVEKHFFLKNVAIFMTNYPELNWGFNDVNDNENANSLLSIPISYVFDVNADASDKALAIMKNATQKEEADLTLKMDENGKINIPAPGAVKVSTGSGSKNSLSKRDSKEREKGTIRYKYRKDKNIFRAFINHPIEITLNKQYCFRYNSNYNTVEFRIFDMPTSLERLLLHYDVAMSIYSLCADYARKRKVLKHTYKKYDYNLEKSIERFNECLTILGVNPARAEEMRDNIRVRYEWSETKEKNYLL